MTEKNYDCNIHDETSVFRNIQGKDRSGELFIFYTFPGIIMFFLCYDMPDGVI